MPLLFLFLFSASAYSGQSVLSLDGVQILRLSPDGMHFALLKRKASVDELFVVHVDEAKVIARHVLSAPQRMDSIAWINNDELAIQRGEDVPYQQRPQRTANTESLMLNGELTQFDGSVAGKPEWQGIFDDSVEVSNDGAQGSRSRERVAMALRKTIPGSEVEIVSSSVDDSRHIARVSEVMNPDSFYLVDTVTGRSQRLLGSQAGLAVVGGDEETTYLYHAFDFGSEFGSTVSGFVSTPEKPGLHLRPLVVVIPAEPGVHQWRREFDEEIWFLNRQGFNVLLVNSAGLNPVEQIDEAVQWTVANEMADSQRICLYGRALGAVVALRVAIRRDDYRCVISMGGDFSATDSIIEALESHHSDVLDLQVLFIDGEDEYPSNAVGREAVLQVLGARSAEVGEMLVAGERSPLTVRRHEVDAFARISSFLHQVIGIEEDFPTLPLTVGQSTVMNELLEAFATRTEEGFFNLRNWRRWFKSHDKAVRKSMSGEQLVLYESLQAELIVMRRDPDWQNVNRPMAPVPGN